MRLFGRKKINKTKRASRRISEINFDNQSNTNPQGMYHPGVNSSVSTFTGTPNTVKTKRVPPVPPPRRKRSSTKRKSVHEQHIVFNPNETAVSTFKTLRKPAYPPPPPPPQPRKSSRRHSRSSARSSARSSIGSRRSSTSSVGSIDWDNSNTNSENPLGLRESRS